MPAHLTIRYADRPARRFTLADLGTYVAGRSDDCDLRLDDGRVSRRHARFEHRDGGWRLVDLGCKNGVRVDGRPVAAAMALPDRCWLSLGGLLARFERLSEEELGRRSRSDAERRQTSLELGRVLDPSRGLPGLLAQLLESVLRLAGAERGFVLLAPTGGDSVVCAERGGAGRLAVAASAGVEAAGGAEAAFSGSAGAVEQALAERRAVVTCDAQDDAVLGSRPSVADDGIRALVCVPLEVAGRAIGAVYADSRTPGSTFTELDVEILEALAGHAGLAIAVARLSREAEDLAGEVPTRWTAAEARPSATE